MCCGVWVGCLEVGAWNMESVVGWSELASCVVWWGVRSEV
jgi:hypothetical protein